MPNKNKENNLVRVFWEKTLRNIIREASWLDFEDEVYFLSREALYRVRPEYNFDLYFPAGTFDSFGVGISRTKDNEHWARDALNDAFDHLAFMEPYENERLILRTVLLAFTVGNRELADKKGKSIMEAVNDLKKNNNPEFLYIHWGVRFDKSFKDKARVFMVINFDLPI